MGTTLVQGQVTEEKEVKVETVATQPSDATQPQDRENLVSCSIGPRLEKKNGRIIRNYCYILCIWHPEYQVNQVFFSYMDQRLEAILELIQGLPALNQHI